MLHKFSGNGCIAHIVCIVLITKDMGEWAFHYCTLSLLRQSSNLMYHWGNVFSWRTHCVIYPLNKLKIIANNYGVPIYILCIIWISNVRKEDTNLFQKIFCVDRFLQFEHEHIREWWCVILVEDRFMQISYLPNN